MAAKKNTPPSPARRSGKANPAADDRAGLADAFSAASIDAHLARREAEKQASYDAARGVLRQTPIARTARRLADAFAHFAEVLEDPDADEEDQELYASFVNNVVAADWNAPPTQANKVNQLFRSISLGEGIIRRLGAEARAAKLLRASDYVIQDFEKAFISDAQRIDREVLAHTLQEWTTPGTNARRRGGRPTGRVGKFKLLQSAIRDTSFPLSATTLKAAHKDWLSRRTKKSKGG